MRLIELISDTIAEFINENVSSNDPSEYTGQHSAPLMDENDPMYNVINMYPDMYTDKALNYYGGYELDDGYVINLIKNVHNKPKALVAIYRAVPNINKKIIKEIDNLNNIYNYFIKYRFFPMKNELINKLQAEVWKDNPTFTYDQMQRGVLEKIFEMVNELKSQKEKPIKINNGDWVTVSKMYAKQHGESNLNNNYKIVTKTVKASQLFTDGNSIFEWGYNA